MGAATIDIVVPIWNRPNETRNCLVNLINFTPGARLIMLDNGSERETEKLLQEIADGLDDRALLMRDDSNVGFVKAANRGLARTEAPLIAVVRSTTQVTAGWLSPLTDFIAAHPEAGILLPRLAHEEPPADGPIEVATASFNAMILTREAYRSVGGFDEEMDGGLWCLKDFTRRACSRGFLTYLVPDSCVAHEEEVLLGSQKRREETVKRSQGVFRERWGEEGNYCVHVPKGLDLPSLKNKLDCLLVGARHGDSYTVLLPLSLYRETVKSGFAFRHENIKLVPLPRFSTRSTKRRLFQRLAAQTPGLTAVAAVDGLPFPWSESYLTFTDLTERIKSC